MCPFKIFVFEKLKGCSVMFCLSSWSRGVLFRDIKYMDSKKFSILSHPQKMSSTQTMFYPLISNEGTSASSTFESQNLSSRDISSNEKSFSGGRWSDSEHELFLRGLKIYNKNWKKLASLIKTRTAVQIRTHAQKYFGKLGRAAHDRGFREKRPCYEIDSEMEEIARKRQNLFVSNDSSSFYGNETTVCYEGNKETSFKSQEISFQSHMHTNGSFTERSYPRLNDNSENTVNSFNYTDHGIIDNNKNDSFFSSCQFAPTLASMAYSTNIFMGIRMEITNVDDVSTTDNTFSGYSTSGSSSTSLDQISTSSDDGSIYNGFSSVVSLPIGINTSVTARMPMSEDTHKTFYLPISHENNMISYEQSSNDYGHHYNNNNRQSSSSTLSNGVSKNSVLTTDSTATRAITYSSINMNSSKYSNTTTTTTSGTNTITTENETRQDFLSKICNNFEMLQDDGTPFFPLDDDEFLNTLLLEE
eukprot:gene2244-4363_t